MRVKHLSHMPVPAGPISPKSRTNSGCITALWQEHCSLVLCLLPTPSLVKEAPAQSCSPMPFLAPADCFPLTAGLLQDAGGSGPAGPCSPCNFADASVVLAVISKLLKAADSPEGGESFLDLAEVCIHSNLLRASARSRLGKHRGHLCCRHW